MDTAVSVFSVDRKVLPLQQRAQFSDDAREVVDRLRDPRHDSDSDVVVLNTCERFEVYGVVGDARAQAVLATVRATYQSSASYDGRAAVRHLFRVASGLESRLLGEPHVLGQVRTALNEAIRSQAVRGAVQDAFSYAIRCGKRVRQRTALGVDAVSYVEQVIARLTTELGTLAQRHIAIVGTGSLATEMAAALKSAGAKQLTVIGRHEERTETLARSVEAHSLSLARLQTNTRAFDAVVAAVSVVNPLISLEAFAYLSTRLVVDLGAAPNVDPAIDWLPGVQVFRLEHFGEKSATVDVIKHAESIVEREVQRYFVVRAPVASAWNRVRRQRAS